jgi:hypothetical protein
MLDSNTYFNNVPLEDDTTILRNKFTNVEEMPVMLQVWACDGTTACSAVIPEYFTKELGESELLNKLRKCLKIDNEYTLKCTNQYTFINYGFSH